MHAARFESPPTFAHNTRTDRSNTSGTQVLFQSCRHFGPTMKKFRIVAIIEAQSSTVLTENDANVK